MKKSKFTEAQIASILEEYEADMRVDDDLCRELNINKQTFYSWKKKYSVHDNIRTL